MERFCVSHDCHRLGCDVEMVQSNVGEWVGYDDASAEIAKLRAERDEAKRCLHVEMSMRKDAEVLPTDTGTGPWRVVNGHDGAKAVRHDDGRFWFNAYFQASIAVDVASLLNRAESLTAALDGEREALSTAQRALANISGCGGCENCGDIASAAFASIDARRAAEAQPKE